MSGSIGGEGTRTMGKISADIGVAAKRFARKTVLTLGVVGTVGSSWALLSIPKDYPQ